MTIPEHPVRAHGKFFHRRPFAPLLAHQSDLEADAQPGGREFGHRADIVENRRSFAGPIDDVLPRGGKRHHVQERVLFAEPLGKGSGAGKDVSRIRRKTPGDASAHGHRGRRQSHHFGRTRVFSSRGRKRHDDGVAHGHDGFRCAVHAHGAAENHCSDWRDTGAEQGAFRRHGRTIYGEGSADLAGSGGVLRDFLQDMQILFSELSVRAGRLLLVQHLNGAYHDRGFQRHREHGPHVETGRGGERGHHRCVLLRVMEKCGFSGSDDFADDAGADWQTRRQEFFACCAKRLLQRWIFRPKTRRIVHVLERDFVPFHEVERDRLSLQSFDDFR